MLRKTYAEVEKDRSPHLIDEYLQLVIQFGCVQPHPLLRNNDQSRCSVFHMFCIVCPVCVCV